jgi:hypothetical protein
MAWQRLGDHPMECDRPTFYCTEAQRDFISQADPSTAFSTYPCLEDRACISRRLSFVAFSTIPCLEDRAWHLLV